MADTPTPPPGTKLRELTDVERSLIRPELEALRRVEARRNAILGRLHRLVRMAEPTEGIFLNLDDLVIYQRPEPNGQRGS